MPEVMSVESVVEMARSGQAFTLNGDRVSTSDLIAIAAAAGRSRATIRFRGLSGRPLEDLMRITVASQGRVVIEEEERRPQLPSAPKRSWFNLRPRPERAFPAGALALGVGAGLAARRPSGRSATIAVR